MSEKDEIAALQARVEELEARTRAPAPVSMEIPKDFQRWDPTENFQVPPSVAREMAKVTDGVMREVAMRDARAPTGPSGQGVIPSTQSVASVRVGGGNTVPLGPSYHQRHVDALLDHADAQDKAERIMRETQKGKG
jgi:hypothetical protein